ncbi:CPBP family intramembrane glutamic endopeptidase [Metabacillus fastidiosus]|uniref:Type II CAAX endopeptidase family protein n=1 Tax=Metabacillus fastidiosus TaxID=1458 RepID=A0ABU6P4H5_9BACI|nr:type II CAAX endopeptidase family protein [Metabacillus fastidiosus]MEC2075151.1 type II CAAX endopeptidase family protein [Metabacillus fastidiosus]MED4404247.1 type II CAAX endopeptidase family protein [Metabacillus fastidiosus]MED4455867.1 type II CAAX endopeptidase family protein [Metabacillus fastidiosus]
MKKQYWLIILTYILMQLSGLIPMLILREKMTIEIAGYWNLFSFAAALIITLFLLRKERNEKYLRGGDPSSVPVAIAWAIGGIFIAFFMQSIAANIELYILKIKPGSENTQQIVEVIKAMPLFIIVTSILGPILEEIIFRKIIFGVLYNRYNFFIAVLISSVIFALVHGEPEHLLLYSSMGFTFAFLYVKTKRIIVPIFAHVAMNTAVVLIQTVYYDKIQEMMKQFEQMQTIIGGF